MTQYEFGIRLKIDGAGQVVAETGKVGQGFEAIETRAGAAMRVVDGMISRLVALGAAYVGVNTVREFVATADAMAGLDGRLRNVVRSTQEYQLATAELYRISQANNVAIDATTTLFTRIIDPVRKLGGGVREATLMVEALSTGLRINNATQAESSSAILQFSQALASGVLRGEEFNAVNEAAPKFMDALASSLGVGRGELRKMAEDGKLTADVVGNAMPRAMAELSSQAAGLPKTVGGAMVDLQNDAKLLAQQLDKTTGATAGLADFVEGAAALMREFTLVLRDTASTAKAAGREFDAMGAAIRVVGSVAEFGLVAFASYAYTLGEFGRQASGLVDQLSAIARGNFSEVKRIGDAVRAQGVVARAEAEAYAARIWGMTDRVLENRAALRDHSAASRENAGALGALTEGAGAVGARYRQLADATSNSSAANNKAAESAAKVLQQYDRVSDGIARKVQTEALEIQQGAKLTEAQRAYLPILEDLRDGKVKYNDLVRAGVIATMEATLATDANNAATKAEAAAKAEAEKATAAAAKSAAQYLDSLQKQTAGLDAEIAKQIEQNETLRTGTRGIADSTAAKYEAAAAAAERAALVALERNEDLALYETLKLQAEKFRELGRLKGEGVHLTAAKEANDAWAATAKSIGDGLTDSLFRAFESGKGFWSTLWDGVKNTVKTTILKPIIEDTVRPFADIFRATATNISSTVLRPTFGTDGLQSFLSAITSGFRSVLSWIGNAFSGVFSSISSGLGGIVSGLGGLFGTSGAAASTGGGLGSLGNLAGIGSTIAGGLGAFGSGASAGLALGAEGIGAAMSMIGSASGVSSMAAGLGQLVGAAGPYALAAAAAIMIGKKLFGGGGGPKTESGFDTTGNGQVIALENPDQARSIFEGVQSLYANYAKALGGTPEALTGTAFVSVDTKGKANTQFVLDAMINGTNVFSRNNRLSGGNVEDVGRSSEALAAAVAEAQTRATLAALQATTFADSIIAEKIRQIDKTGSASAISQQIQTVLAYKAEQDIKAQADAAAAAAATAASSVSSASGPAWDPGAAAQMYQAASLSSDGMLSEMKAMRQDLRPLLDELQKLRADGVDGRSVVDRAAVAVERIEQLLRAVSPDGRSFAVSATS